VNIDDQKLSEEDVGKINWAPTMNAIIPDTFECPQEFDEKLTPEQEIFIGDIRALIDETRIAALCCEQVFSNHSSLRICNYFRILVMLSIGVYPFIILSQNYIHFSLVIPM
jgi:hypothetical protein